MKDLLPLAEKIGALLKQRKETVAIAESSSGGLIAASMLSVAGASAYFLGGVVVYTRKSMQELLGLTEESFKGMRGLTEATALVLARGAREDQCGRLGQSAHALERFLGQTEQLLHRFAGVDHHAAEKVSRRAGYTQHRSRD